MAEIYSSEVLAAQRNACGLAGYSNVECCVYEANDAGARQECQEKMSQFTQGQFQANPNASCAGTTFLLGVFNKLSYYIMVNGCNPAPKK